jgi:hypothetical protein
VYPIGHVAISYIVARPLLRSQPTVVEMAALTAGTLFPSASNITLQYINLFGIGHYWSHSPLLLLPLGILGVLALRTAFPFRRVPLIFALGMLSHLVLDFLFDFPLIYFSNDVDDVGGHWFYPWRPFLIRYNGPGFDILPWELMVEGVLLMGILLMWKRLDLVLYSAVVVAVTIAAVAYNL